MQTIWITGAEGHIGTALTSFLDCTEYELLCTDKNEVDITDLKQVKQYVKVNRPDVIINCASIIDVEYCETHIDDAYNANAVGVRNIALAANEVNAKVIQMSTDDVFDLNASLPYNEFDQIHPTTVYGKSKAAGEKFLTQLMSRFVIIRSSWLYGIGRDFVQEVLDAAESGATLYVPNNRFAAPTSAKELAKVIAYFIDNDEYGIYHVVCKGSCNRYEFAKTILEYSGNTDKLTLEPIISTNTQRPAYSVLDNMMLRLTGIEEPADWRTALKEYLESR